MIPKDINDRHSRSMIESTATPGVPARAVVNPDGSNIASDVVSQLEVMNSLVPNKYDSVVITYTDSTKKTIDSPAWTEPILTVTWTEPSGASFTQKVVMF